MATAMSGLETATSTATATADVRARQRRERFGPTLRREPLLVIGGFILVVVLSTMTPSIGHAAMGQGNGNGNGNVGNGNGNGNSGNNNGNGNIGDNNGNGNSGSGRGNGNVGNGFGNNAGAGSTVGGASRSDRGQSAFPWAERLNSLPIHSWHGREGTVKRP